MAEDSRSLRDIHTEAEARRATIENSSDSNSTSFQDNVRTAIQLYRDCLTIADRIALFSPNESLEDISSVDLQFLLLHYHLAELTLRLLSNDRKATLHTARDSYDQCLKRLDNYDILSKEDARLLEQFHDAPDTFSVVASTDAAARRDTKIRRFREEKALKEKLQYLRKNPLVAQNDEDAVRELHLTSISFATHQTFQNLESIAQELHILSLAPPAPPPGADRAAQDVREETRQSAGDRFSERLDTSHLSAGLRGPLLDSNGRPLRPFTLTSKRQQFREGVFRLDHSLPTMSIDEYLEEERRRGGMIEGGGPQSEVKPVIDEDDMDAADRETMKAREWDEYVEANPKGSGNTLNRG